MVALVESVLGQPAEPAGRLVPRPTTSLSAHRSRAPLRWRRSPSRGRPSCRMTDWPHTPGTDGARRSARHSRTHRREHRPDHRADSPVPDQTEPAPRPRQDRPPSRWRWAGRASARPVPKSPGRKCDRPRPSPRRQQSLLPPRARGDLRHSWSEFHPQHLGAAVRRLICLEAIPVPQPTSRTSRGPQAPDRAVHRSPHRDTSAGTGAGRPRLAGRTIWNVPGPEVALRDGRVLRWHPRMTACPNTRTMTHALALARSR